MPDSIALSWWCVLPASLLLVALLRQRLMSFPRFRERGVLRRLWQRLFERRAPRGFRVRPCAPAVRRTARKPAWVKREVLRLATLTDAGCRTIEKLFNRIYARSRAMTVGKSYVSYTIRDHLYEIEALRRKLKRRVPKASPNNRLWALDLTGKEDLAGELHPILGIEDHGTRKLLALEALQHKNTWTLLGQLTLKAKLDHIDVYSREALAGLLVQFRSWYNAVRPHQHLGGLTPEEAWRGIDPYARAPKTVHPSEAWDGLLRGYYLRH